ncbi:uncharacterized protein LOC141682976 [Apium graveolens]|uniref:uncharacterized protein LOC141682976 n=1 Tax=Apium graveolens TaxID=4045 RepID=UPI003D790C85
MPRLSIYFLGGTLVALFFSAAQASQVIIKYTTCNFLVVASWTEQWISGGGNSSTMYKRPLAWDGNDRQNQVLRAREIDPKSLIIEAYEKGLMIALIPFTSKVCFWLQLLASIFGGLNTIKGVSAF